MSFGTVCWQFATEVGNDVANGSRIARASFAAGLVLLYDFLNGWGVASPLGGVYGGGHIDNCRISCYFAHGMEQTKRGLLVRIRFQFPALARSAVETDCVGIVNCSLSSV